MKDLKLFFLRLIKIFTGVFSLVLFGTSGYMLVEKWNFIDAFFMSVITFTTVGYGSVHPLSIHGKIFTVIYILVGVILFLYFASVFAEYVLLINFGELLNKKKMETKINKLKDHYIICGFGRTGMEIAKQLENKNLCYVIIDKKTDNIGSFSGHLNIQGDATDDEILEKAGISRAKGLFCSLSDDVDNLYLTLSARNLNKDLNIVSRCVKSSNETKFKKAGASSVILPYEISGRSMVSSVTKPLVSHFLDVIMHTKGQDLELNLEQYKIKKDSYLENKTIVSSDIKQKTGVIIIAINRDNEYLTNPASDTVIKEGDYLIVLGNTPGLVKFEELIF